MENHFKPVTTTLFTPRLDCRGGNEVFYDYVITKTGPCNVYPLEPHFYIAKLGYAGVYLFLAHLSR